MPSKRKILEALTRERLLEFAKSADVTGVSARPKAEIVDELAAAKRARLRDFLPGLSRDELKDICNANNLDDSGREKQLLIDRLLGEEPEEPPTSAAAAKPARKHAPPIDDYRHEEVTRKNIPPAKIAAEGKVPAKPKAEYSYHPRLPPVLRFDSHGDADKLPELLAAAKKRPLTEDEARLLAQALRIHQPWLEWAGKRELPGFAVDPVALHIHERVSAQAIIKVAARQDVTRDLFADPEQDYRDAVRFYEHDVEWANRLILGDSLQVMASLAKREDLAGKVQMIYIDPPYGIKFASNFQPEIGKKTVSDKENDLTREAEMVRAFRDTWHLGIHSYLSYLRDRMIAARELLADSGSVFVQISEENVHLVREIMDEVFGIDNYVNQISFMKTAGLASDFLATTNDFLIWYSRDRTLALKKFRRIYGEKTPGGDSGSQYNWVETPLGDRSLSPAEFLSAASGGSVGGKIFSHQSGYTAGSATTTEFDFNWNSQQFGLPTGQRWRTTKAGMSRLGGSGRFMILGNSLRYKRYLSDFPVFPITDSWRDTSVSGFAETRRYVVQTNPKVVERCVLMTTDPGDLVLDPTCGSGTTAFVAEQWGRRWITIDTSRVAVSIARQRLLTTKFDYYQIREGTATPTDTTLEYAHRGESPSGGFIYRTVSHITLRSITQNDKLDPIFARHESVLGAALKTCNAALAKVTQDTRNKLTSKLQLKATQDGKRSVTDADRRRWLLPKNKFEHWTMPFDTDPDWPEELAHNVTAYRVTWRAKMDEVNACIAANAEQEELVDKPEIVRGTTRVSGPFTVEAVQPAELNLGEVVMEFDGSPSGLEGTFQAREVTATNTFEVKNVEAYLDEMTRLLKLDGVRFPNNKEMVFSRLERLRDSSGLHAAGRWVPRGETDPDPEGDATVGVAFGPQYGPFTDPMLEPLIKPAGRRYDDLVIAGFSFTAEIHDTAENTQHPTLKIHVAHIRPDVNPGMSGLLKDTPRSQLFTVFGQPRTSVSGPNKQGEYTVTMEGVDVFDPVKNTIHPTGADKVAAWFLDGDYDGRCFCITQAFFPDKSAWEKLAKALGGVVDSERFEALSGTVSLPFPLGAHKQVAVKVIDPRGNEVMQVHKL